MAGRHFAGYTVGQLRWSQVQFESTLNKHTDEQVFMKKK